VRAIETKPLPTGSLCTKLLPDSGVALAGEGRFEGYASLFEVPDLGRDVVVAGAFRESLARRGAANVRLLWQHDVAEPIGRWLSIREDQRGLKVEGELNLAVARAREVLALLRQGAVDGLSIGYRVERAAPRRGGLRRLERIDLVEISIVTFPMLPTARISAVKLSPPRRGEERLAAAIRRAARALRPA
jgi:uncharacterized protein